MNIFTNFCYRKVLQIFYLNGPKDELYPINTLSALALRSVLYVTCRWAKMGCVIDGFFSAMWKPPITPAKSCLHPVVHLGV